MPKNRNVSEVWDKAMSCTAEGISLSEITMPDQPLVYVNGGFELMTGYKKDEVIGKNCRFLQGEDTDKDQVKKIRDAVEKRESCTIEFVNYHKNGTKFWNRLTVSPVSEASDEIQYYVGIQSDITHLKNIEAELIKYSNELELRNQKIKESVQSFDHALGRALYDANQSTKKLLQDAGINDSEVKKALQNAHDSTDKASDIVLNIRTLMSNMGGLDLMHNIDMNGFQAKRNFTKKD